MPDLSCACHAVAAGVGPEHLGPYLIVAAVLFALGVGVVTTRRNAVGFLMGVELMLNAAALNFASYARFRPGGGAFDGQVMALFMIVLAAAGAAVALALLFALFRTSDDIDLDAAVVLASDLPPALGEVSSRSPSGVAPQAPGEASSSSPSGVAPQAPGEASSSSPSDEAPGEASSSSPSGVVPQVPGEASSSSPSSLVKAAP